MADFCSCLVLWIDGFHTQMHGSSQGRPQSVMMLNLSGLLLAWEVPMSWTGLVYMLLFLLLLTVLCYSIENTAKSEFGIWEKVNVSRLIMYRNACLPDEMSKLNINPLAYGSLDLTDIHMSNHADFLIRNIPRVASSIMNGPGMTVFDNQCLTSGKLEYDETCNKAIFEGRQLEDSNWNFVWIQCDVHVWNEKKNKYTALPGYIYIRTNQQLFVCIYIVNQYNAQQV